jgi:hypothetical protein
MKSNNYLLFSISLLFFAVCLVKIDRFFLKKNSGFCLHFIHAPLSHNSQWEISTPLPEKVFDQKFFYLGKGSQTYVFESEDKDFVLKFYKFPSHMRTIGWLKHPIAYRFGEKRVNVKNHNEKRFHLSYESFLLAHTELADETGVTYAHLNPSSSLNKTVTLVDKLGVHYQISLDAFGFVLQKKAAPLFPFLTQVLEKKDLDLGKKVVGGVIQTIKNRCQKGISDLDNMENDNYGWLEDKAIHIDVGRFVRNPSVQQPEIARQEVIRITQKLSDFLAQNSPELYAYYQEQIR